jgi:hypothetical protein
MLWGEGAAFDLWVMSLSGVNDQVDNRRERQSKKCLQNPWEWVKGVDREWDFGLWVFDPRNGSWRSHSGADSIESASSATTSAIFDWAREANFAAVVRADL